MFKQKGHGLFLGMSTLSFVFVDDMADSMGGRSVGILNAVHMSQFLGGEVLFKERLLPRRAPMELYFVWMGMTIPFDSQLWRICFFF